MSRLKRVPQQRFPPVGKCIYCGDIDKPLTDEHIVPFGLAGHLLLPKASCVPCAKITHAYEYTVQRSVFGNLRMRFGFPTRRPKDRPTHIEINTKLPNGQVGRRKVPIGEYPVGALIPHYGRASIFLGGLSWVDSLQDTAVMYANGDLDAFLKKYNWDGTVTLRHHPIQFGQMIIKICYGMAVAALGTDAFDPICLDQILSKDRNISHIFGQCGQNQQKEGNSPLFDHQMIYRIVNDELVLMAHFSLFPGAGTPIYEVAIGRINRPQHLARVQQQIADNVLVEVA